jgi:hypothetical protein|nr:MAG TPA: hypothetical protein [Caudoviricetes sp.]
MEESKQRDEIVLEALERNIKEAPRYGVCCDVFVALLSEFQRVMDERDALIAKGA